MIEYEINYCSKCGSEYVSARIDACEYIGIGYAGNLLFYWIDECDKCITDSLLGALRAVSNNHK